MKIKLIGAATALAALCAASGASAQTAAAAGAQGAGYSLTGNLPGVCIMSLPAVLAESAAGKFVEQRMKSLQTQYTTELNPEKTWVETEAKALSGVAQPKTAAEQTVLQTRAQAFATRRDALLKKSDERGKQLQDTSRRASEALMAQVRPVVNQISGQRSCALLLSDAGVHNANPSMDISSAVVQALDAKVKQVSF